MNSNCLLEMKRINKQFPGVWANRNIDFDVNQGEVHALLGENGAGKSTLMNILFGLYRPDSGEVRWKNQKVTIENPKNSIDLGIGMVHQHFMLIPKLTVVENIVLGMKEDRRVRLDLKKAAANIERISKDYGMQINPLSPVEELSIGEQQRVEIIKALYRGAELLILDEPSAVLTPSEVVELFKTINLLKQQNRSIIFISHKLDEVLQICDRITILRDGRKIETLHNSPDLKKNKLAYMMVGREVSLEVDKFASRPGDRVLSVKNLTLKSPSGNTILDNLSFDIHQGEVFGVAGVDGNGQSELSEVIMGLRKPTSGSVEILGDVVTNVGTSKIRQYPLAYIPEDRHGAALIYPFTVADNLVLNDIGAKPYGSSFHINKPNIRKNATKQIDDFRIATPSYDTQVLKLSGGNQQKVVLAREIKDNVQLIIAIQPTRGLDIDATRFVFDTILTARDHRAAVLYISTELEEVMSMSDRLGVIFKGSFKGILSSSQFDFTNIGLMMAGVSVDLPPTPLVQAEQDWRLEL